MIPEQHWARQFTISDGDIDDLVNHLLENETPLSTRELTGIVLHRRFAQEKARLEARYEDMRPYDPAQTYTVGDRLIFPALAYQVGEVVGERPGEDETGTAFTVISVQMEGAEQPREFAAAYPHPHPLNLREGETVSLPQFDEHSIDSILLELGDSLMQSVEARLRANGDLVSLAGKWFPVSLMLDINAGHLNLAEAILDMNEGGPLTTAAIIGEIGGVGSAPEALQIFSMNYALNQDARFDEVGPVNQVLWFLKRLEPNEVQNTPFQLRYTPIEYDASLLSAELRALEREIEDEWSDLPEPADEVDEVTITLNYPHRRAGTLPLNSRMQAIFPTARKTERIHVTLIDGQDGEEYTAWVVRKDRYVFGMNKLYRKYRLPVGASVVVSPADEPGKIIVDFRALRQRTEYVRLVVPKEGQLTFEEEKRTINAEYDDLMILGADDIASVDALHQANGGPKRSLHAVIRNAMHELGRLVPQGNVHAKTVYSMVNVVRRTPPGPVFAALVASPEFTAVGSNYWRMVEE